MYSNMGPKTTPSLISKGGYQIPPPLAWDVVFPNGCRGFLQELPWFYTRVAMVFSDIAKLKSTPNPRPKTGVRQHLNNY